MKSNINPVKIGFRKKIALNLYGRYRKNQIKLHELKYLFWECTLRCNLNCIHCGSDCLKQSTEPDMPLNVFLQVLDEISGFVEPSQTMIALTGGEPTVRSDLELCGKEISKRGFPWGMVSNGLLLNEDKLHRLLDSGLKSVTVSLDGLSENHDWFRGKQGSFQKALQAIELIAKTKGLTYDIATCIHQKNIEEIESLYNLLLEIGVNHWRIFSIFPKGRAANNEILKPSKELLLTLFDFIKSKRNEGKMSVYYGCEGFLGDYEGEVRDSFFACMAGIKIGSVLNDGSISACPSLRNDFIQGNVYNDSFMEVWNNRYQNMRDRSWTKKGICQHCSSYKWCNGNGLHLWDESRGDLAICHLNMMSGN